MTMKNVMLAMLVMTFFSFSACCQAEKDVPEKVQNAFSQKFPDASKVKWEKENDTEWEAEFKLYKVKYSANFDNEGNWKETEHAVKMSELPELVKATLDSEFADFKIEEAEVSETADGTFYEFELEKGKTEMEVTIDTQGKVVKKEQEKEDGEDRDED